MAYISEIDLKKYLTENQIQIVKRSAEGNIDYIEEAIETAESYVRDRLNYKYDMVEELAKTGTSRNPTLISIISMMAIKELLVPFDLYQDGREDQFAEASAKLDMIENGTLLSDVLPAYDPETRRIYYGTNENYDLQF